jgi:hypothetical protein
MKRTKIFIGAFTLISLFIIGMTVQIKATNFIKSWFSKPVPEPTGTPTHTTNNNNEDVIQLALLLDTSGSMNGLIEQTKSQLWKIVNELSTLKRNGESLPLEIALYEYGTRNYGHEDYIRKISNFTTDMDAISENLFALRTNGSTEYCGLVMQKSLNELQWSNHENSLRMIYIAGNESFAQGRINYRQVVKNAKEQGILINTIFCGPQEQGIALQWQSGATLAGGEFVSIDHNQQTVYVESPYDKEISELNEALNDTYISYGNEGQKRKENMKRQDANASSYSLANIVERSAFKSSNNYSNEKWAQFNHVFDYQNAEVKMVKNQGRDFYEIDFLKNGQVKTAFCNLNENKRSVIVKDKKLTLQPFETQIF